MSNEKRIETPEEMAERLASESADDVRDPLLVCQSSAERAIRARDEQIVARLRDVLPMCMRDGESTLDMLEDIIRDLGGEIDPAGSQGS